MDAHQRPYYLLPGFMVTVSERRGFIRFPQLDGNLRQATPARLAVAQAMSRGGEETQALLLSLAQRFGGTMPGLSMFVDGLLEQGLLSEAGQPALFQAEMSVSPSRQPLIGQAIVATPLTFLLQDGEFLWFDREGELRLKLTLAEILATSVLTVPCDRAEAWDFYRAEAHDADAIDETQFDDLLSRLQAAGVLVAPELGFVHMEEDKQFNVVDRNKILSLVDARIAAHDREVADSGRKLTQVCPVNTRHGMAPQSLGLIMAYAMEYENGRLGERYNFVPMFLTDQDRLLDRAAEPGVYLFSNYLWNEEENLALSAAVKAISPQSITIHGGPSTPKYEGEAETWFAENPHVDIAVRGEGEATLADILDKLDIGSPNPLEAMCDVPGLTYRTVDGVARSGDRERIADLNTIPSPFLKGLFDEFGSVRAGAIVESNRGCPYGCTFCDWGSATLSKVRKFDLDRVYKELEWCARHKIEDASIADANFGMIERDVDITEKVADLKREYDYPRTVSINYAKNQVRYLKKIIDIMASAGILTEGKVSLQSMDAQTLKVIDRSNIKLEKYNELTTEFRRARLPLAAELMMGLPGSTAASFREDLQKCADSDIRAMLNPTQLLPNSPMNAPDYREKYGIVAKPGELVRECYSYTREEWEDMYSLRTAYYLLDSYGLARYVARFVRSETGIGEVEFYDGLRIVAHREPQKWPILSRALDFMEGYMAPPASWGLFVKELERYLREKLQMEYSSGMRTALAVQLAQLPSPGRRFPEQYQLEHDFAAWWEVVLRTREEGHRDDWEQHAPKLAEFGPATFTIEDPNGICQRDLGKPLYVLLINIRTWELDSPVTRPRVWTETSLTG